MTRREQSRSAFALSDVQSAIWFDQMLAPGTVRHHIGAAVQLRFAVDDDVARSVLQHVVDINDSLRTTFGDVDGVPTQTVNEQLPVDFDIVDGAGWSVADIDARLTDHHQRRFDLEAGPLVRFLMVRRTAEDSILSFVLHHLIADMWSIALLGHLIADGYRRALAGEPFRDPGQRETYRDFVESMDALASDESAASTREFWRPIFENWTASALVPDRRAHIDDTGLVVTEAVELDSAVTAGLRRAAADLGVSVRSVILAAFHVVLHAHSGAERTLIGELTANRSMSRARLIGCCINQVPRSATFDGSTTLESLVTTIHADSLAARPHERYPFARLLRELRPGHKSEPFFDVLFSWQKTSRVASAQLSGALAANKHDVSSEVGGFQVEPEPSPARSGAVPLSLLAVSHRDDFELVFDYQSALFDEISIKRLAHGLRIVLKTFVDDCDSLVDAIDVVTPAEIAAWTNSEPSVDLPCSIVPLIEDQAQRTPDAQAICTGPDAMTHGEIDRRANQLAHRLLVHGVKRGDLVGICLDRSVEAIISMLATWKTGAGYVSMDPTLPPQRLGHMVEDSGLGVVITNNMVWSDLAPCSGPADATLGALATIRLDDHDNLIDRLPTDRPDVDIAGHDLAYVFFTSGSTGRPKGVAVEHRNLANFLISIIERLGITAADTMLAATTFSFDPAVLEVIAPLLVGGRAMLVERDVVLDAALLSQTLERVTIAQGTPTMWKLLVDSGWTGSASLTCLSGGEVLTRSLADALLDRTRSVWNLYGPTETTVWASAEPVAAGTEAISIGQPISHVRFYALDESRSMVPTGRQGELWIGGAGVARGYVGQPDLTAERFVEDPFADPGHRMYRTGDLVRRCTDGRIEFRGRVDHQVKLRGHRIELGDIETALERSSGVDRAVVVVRQFGVDDDRLVAYFTTPSGADAPLATGASTDAQTTSLRRHLRRELPSYMLPATFVPVAQFEVNQSNKIDRNRLPDPPRPRSSQRTRPDPNRGPDPHVDREVVDVVLHVFQEVFGDNRIGYHDDFFDLGGHSLLATQIISRLRHRLGREVPLRALFEQSTPNALATAAITSAASSAGPQESDFESTVDPAAGDAAGAQQTYALSFSQERMWFVHEMHPDSAAYNLATSIRVTGQLDVGQLELLLRRVVRRHTSLRSRFVEIDGTPRVRVEPSFEIDVPVSDLRGFEDRIDQQAHLSATLETDAKRPFMLDTLPLLRVHVYQLGDTEFTASIVMHHIISDQWSFGVLARELAAGMTAASAIDRHDPSMNASDVSRAELYGEWQRGRSEIGAFDSSLDYWREQLRDLPTIDFPSDSPRPELPSTNGNTISLELADHLVTAIRTIASDHGATEFMVLLAAFNALVHRATGADDIAIGVPIANRHWLESESLISSLVNTLVIRTQVTSSATFADLLEQVRDVSLDAYAHQDVPFGQLVQVLAPPRDSSRAPLFQLFFNMQNAIFELPAIDGLHLEHQPIRRGAAQFDISLNIDATLSRAVELEYATDLFDEERMVRLLNDYVDLLTEISVDVNAPVNGASSHAVVPRAGADPATPQPTLTLQPAEPRPGLERQVADVWAHVLGTPSINRHDNFFDLGGHSILAIRIFAELEQRTGRRPPLATLFRAPTVAGFAEILRSEGWMTPWTSMIELRPGTARRPLFYVSPYLISSLSLYELARQLDDTLPMYVFEPQGLETDDPVHQSVEDMAAHYIREMQTLQPTGPYSLGGHCAGGWVAFEMARQLQDAGFEVQDLFVVDIEPPGIQPPRPNWLRLVASRIALYGRHGQVFSAVKWKLDRGLERLRSRRSAPLHHDHNGHVRYLHEEAHRVYRGGNVEGDMMFIRSEEWSRLQDKDWHTDWSKLISGDLHVAVVPGAHSRLLDGDSAVDLAKLINTALRTENAVFDA